MSKYRYITHIPHQTSIVASRAIILEICAICRQYFKKKDLAGLRDVGIWVQRDRRKWGLVISHPRFAMASKQEKEAFDHYALAKQITTLWRKANLHDLSTNLFQNNQKAPQE